MLTLHAKTFVPYLSPEQIQAALRHMAARIEADYAGQDLLLVGVLTGSFVFAADLVRLLSPQRPIAFLRVASYEGTASTGRVTELLGLQESVTGRHVLLLEDIVDTGHTMAAVCGELAKQGPASIHIAALLSKPECHVVEVPLRYAAFEIGPEFVVGYGLDYDGLGRGLEGVWRVG